MEDVFLKMLISLKVKPFRTVTNLIPTTTHTAVPFHIFMHLRRGILSPLSTTDDLYLWAQCQNSDGKEALMAFSAVEWSSIKANTVFAYISLASHKHFTYY